MILTDEEGNKWQTLEDETHVTSIRMIKPIPKEEYDHYKIELWNMDTSSPLHVLDKILPSKLTLKQAKALSSAIEALTHYVTYGGSNVDSKTRLNNELVHYANEARKLIQKEV